MTDIVYGVINLSLIVILLLALFLPDPPHSKWYPPWMEDQ